MLKKFYSFIICFSLSVNFSFANVADFVEAPSTIAGQAIVMDYDTGEVLYDKNADKLVPPSSMSKLMTIYVLFDKIRNGQIKLTDEFTITNSVKAKAIQMERQRGSHMGIHTLNVGDKIKVEDLIKGIIVLSGNDACVLVAESIGGTEEAFVAEMMEYAKKLGMNNTYLKNVSGWEDEAHLMSVRDLAILASHLISDFPEFYHYFSVKQFVYDENVLWNSYNRNDLLRSQVGADGLKTGHTDAGGYSITASIKLQNRRFIIVVNGLMNRNGLNSRFTEVKKLFNWAFQNFDNYIFFKPEDEVVKAKVWFGKKREVALTVSKPVILTLPKNMKPSDVKIKAVYDSPINGGFSKGKNVGQLVLTLPDGEERKFDLITKESVESMSIFGKFFENIRQIFLSILG